MDHKLWSKLQEMACSRHLNIESLKQSLRKAAADFLVVLRSSIDGWPKRLKDCVSANGDNFE